MKVPFFVGFYSLKVLLASLGQSLNQKRVEVKLSVLKGNIFECSFSVFCVKIVLLDVVECKWLRWSLIVILLQRIYVFACLSIPDVDSAIKRGSHQDTLFLDELQDLYSFCVGFHLPFEIDTTFIQDIFD